MERGTLHEYVRQTDVKGQECLRLVIVFLTKLIHHLFCHTGKRSHRRATLSSQRWCCTWRLENGICHHIQLELKPRSDG
jgi:hypothetical protein